MGRAHPRQGRRVRPRLVSAGIRDLRPQRDARLHGVLRDAVALPALVVRQVLRKAQDALRLRGQRPAVRDGDQLEPGDRLPDARQHAAAADSHDRARLRPQRFLQKQFHLSNRRARNSPSRLFKAHALRVRRYVEDPSIGVEKVERILDAAHALRCNAGAIWRFASSSREEQVERAVEARATAQSIRFIASMRAPEFNEPDIAQGAARARRGPAAVHPRPQSVPRGMGKRPAHHRGRGSEVLPAR